MFAKDYGRFLQAREFVKVNMQNYVPQKGDVAVVQSYAGGNIAGHIGIYNG